jgi:hypothetical protein
MRLTREQLEAIRNKDWTRYHMVPLSCIDSLIEHINVLEADITTRRAETAAMLEKAISTFPQSTVKDVIQSAYARAFQDGVMSCKVAIRALIPTDYAAALEEHDANLRKQICNEGMEREPCGHFKSNMIGDEHGHFTCDACKLLEQRLNEARAEARRDEHIRSCQRCVCCEKCKSECSRLRELNRLPALGGEGRSK